MSPTTGKLETLDDLLTDWCKRAAIDDHEVARRMAVSYDTVGNWRRNESAPNWLKWPALASHAARSIEDVAIAIAHGALVVTTGRDGATDSRKKLPRRALSHNGVR